MIRLEVGGFGAGCMFDPIFIIAPLHLRSLVYILYCVLSLQDEHYLNIVRLDTLIQRQ